MAQRARAPTAPLGAASKALSRRCGAVSRDDGPDDCRTCPGRGQPMTPARRRSPSCVRDAGGADLVDGTEQTTSSVMDGVWTGGLPATTDAF
jgi:hypothetical protein